MQISSTTRMLLHLLLFLGICVCYGMADNKTMASDSPTLKTTTAANQSTADARPLDCPCGTIIMVRNTRGQMVEMKRDVCKNPSNPTYPQYCFHKIVFAPCSEMSVTDCSRDSTAVYIKHKFGRYQMNTAENMLLISLSLNNYVKLENGKLSIYLRCEGFSGCRRLFRDGLMTYTNGRFHHENSSVLPSTSHEMREINAYLKQIEGIKKLTFDNSQPPGSMESDHRYSPAIADMLKPGPSKTPASTAASLMASHSESTSASSQISSTSEETSTSSSKLSGSGNYAHQNDNSGISSTEKSDSNSRSVWFWVLVVYSCIMFVVTIVLCGLFLWLFAKFKSAKTEEEQLIQEKQQYETSLREQSTIESELNATLARCVIREADLKAKIAEYEISDPIWFAKVAAEEVQETDLKASIETIKKAQAEFDRELLNAPKLGAEENKNVTHVLAELQKNHKTQKEEKDREIMRLKKVSHNRDADKGVVNTHIETGKKKLAAAAAKH